MVTETLQRQGHDGGTIEQDFTGKAGHITDPIILSGNAQATLAISSTGAQTAALSEGKYAVWTTVDCFIKVHATTASNVTTSTGYPIYAAATPLKDVVIPSGYVLGAITGGASGTLSYHKVD